LRMSGLGGRISTAGFSCEGFNGVGIELDGPVGGVFNDLFVLDSQNDGNQVAFRYTSGNPAFLITMYDPEFTTGGNGWKNSAPIHFDSSAPPLLIYAALTSRSYAGYWEGGASGYVFRCVTPIQVDGDMMPRFTMARIDSTPQMNLRWPGGGSSPTRIWLENDVNGWFTNVAPDGDAHRNGDIVIMTPSIQNSTGVFCKVRVNGTWETISFDP
jgi:hypothetical protein